MRTVLVDLKRTFSVFSLSTEDLRERTPDAFTRLRTLWTTPFTDISRKIGRVKGRQAPTIPREASTIGQYKVGVKISALDQLEAHLTKMCTHTSHVVIRQRFREMGAD